MKVEVVNSQWVRIGQFASKTGLITHLWLVFRKEEYQPDRSTGKANYEIVNRYDLMASVKNTGSTFLCASFFDKDEANAALESALKVLC